MRARGRRIRTARTTAPPVEQRWLGARPASRSAWSGSVRDACAKSGGVWRASRHISVNGLNIDTSGTFAINPKKLRLSASGDVTVSASRARAVPVTRLTMELAGSFKLEAAAGAKLKRFPIQGKIKGKFANGKITFDVFVGMPVGFRRRHGRRRFLRRRRRRPDPQLARHHRQEAHGQASADDQGLQAQLQGVERRMVGRPFGRDARPHGPEGQGRRQLRRWEL